MSTSSVVASTVDEIDLFRKREDTRRHVFVIKQAGAVVDVSAWTGFFLTLHSVADPVDDTTKINQFVGAILDGPNGRVSFTPDGLTPVGRYFYDAQAVDDNSEKITFVEGRYMVDQDRTKD